VISIAATEASEVTSIEREVLIEFLQRHPPAMLRMLQGLAEYVRADAHEMTNIAYRQIRERLAVQLLELADAAPKPAQTLTLSQTTLAAMIGATRENVNRALAGIVADGHIRTRGRSLTILDPAGLRRLGARAVPLLPPPNYPPKPTGHEAAQQAPAVAEREPHEPIRIFGLGARRRLPRDRIVELGQHTGDLSPENLTLSASSRSSKPQLVGHDPRAMRGTPRASIGVPRPW
jgi:hypothetical protein